MAHFAKINEQNIVEQVIVIADEHEKKGEAFIKDVLKLEGRWLQTSYNNRIRKRFAGIGYTYSEEHDAFIPPKPNIEGKTIIFDEEELCWVEEAE